MRSSSTIVVKSSQRRHELLLPVCYSCYSCYLCYYLCLPMPGRNPVESGEVVDA